MKPQHVQNEAWCWNIHWLTGKRHCLDGRTDVWFPSECSGRLCKVIGFPKYSWLHVATFLMVWQFLMQCGPRAQRSYTFTIGFHSWPTLAEISPEYLNLYIYNIMYSTVDCERPKIYAIALLLWKNTMKKQQHVYNISDVTNWFFLVFIGILDCVHYK